MGVCGGIPLFEGSMFIREKICPGNDLFPGCFFIKKGEGTEEKRKIALH